MENCTRSKLTHLLRNISFLILSFTSVFQFFAQEKIDLPWQSLKGAREEVSLRDANSKHFVLQDGSISAFVASGIIHYEKNGSWLDINNHIVANNTGFQPSYPYANVSNSIESYFPSNPFSSPIISKHGEVQFYEQIQAINFVDPSGNFIQTLPISSNVSVNVNGSSIEYSGFYPGMKLVYSMSNSRRKFDLVIENANVLNSFPSNASRFEITEAITSNNSNIVFSKDAEGLNASLNGVDIVQFEKPKCFDSNPNVEQLWDKASFVSKANGKSTDFISSFDISWMKNAERIFPIHLDPIANFLPTLTTNWTGYQTSSTGKTSGYLRITGGTTASWSKYNISSIAVGSTISSVSYYGNHYTGTNTTLKNCRLRHMASDPVPATAATLWSASTTGAIITPDFGWAQTTYGWKTVGFNATGLTNVQNALSQGWYAAGTQYASGGTSFSYHYGVNGTSATCTYLQINYTLSSCSGTPNAGTSTITASSGCAGTSFTLSASGISGGLGITYQWQYSLDNVTWSNITGATSSSYLTSTTATTFYRLVTTCTNSGLTNTSSTVSYTITASGTCVCGAYPVFSASSTADEEITNVTVGTMTNSSACGTTAGGAGSITYRYSNYSGIVSGPTAMQGGTVNFSLTQTSCGGAYSNFFQIYADWNQDGDWLDAGEQVYSQGVSVTGNHTVTGSFTVPVTAAVGTTRMRIVNVEATASTANYAHTGYTWGETEDYCFTVTALTGCSGTPNAGVAAASLTTVCSGSTTSLSATGLTTGGGITYQWQSSTDNATWANIGGATASTYNATVSANTYYRVVTTCTNSGLSANSSSVLVNAVSCCNYTFRMTDSFGDGWNGATMQVRIGTTVVQTIGSTFTTGTQQNVLIPLQSGTVYNLYYVGAGTYPTEVGIQIIDPNNTTIYTLAAGAGAVGTQLTTWTANCPTPCTGAPSAANASANPSQVSAGGTTTLSLSPAQTASGITYQWQSSSDNATWSNIAGATGTTYVATPTAATYYRCVITCSGSGQSTNSGSTYVTFNPYCNPAYTYGTTDGDLISNVVIAGTTLSNNTGTTPGLAYYNFYTGQPNYTANLVAANSYNVSVTAGSFTNQNFAAWIDYNDNNVFEASEKIGFSTAATTAAFQTVSFPINLSCTPPLGNHRMRIRGVYATAGSTIDPCATYNWGETEDYIISIVPGAPFTPAFLTTPTTPNCVGVQVTYTATAGQTNYAWTFPGTATIVSGGTSTSNTATVVYNSSGSQTISMNYASPLGCASSGAINNTITVGAGTLNTSAANGDVIWRGATSVDWQTASNWYYYDGTSYTVAGSTPTSATRTIIPNNTCVTQQPSVAAGTTVNAKDVVIETGATLTMTTGTLNVNGNFTNNGTFVAGTGKVAFNTAATVSGNATTFFDVDVNNGVNFGSSLSTVNGTMTINNGGWVNTNPPTYGLNSLLKYNTGGTYGRWLEWSATSGPGYPNDVQVSNNTTINYPNTGGAFSTNLGVRRNLTIDGGSNVYMDYGTGNASGSLTVGGNVTSAGDLSLGNQIGGDIYVGGNWTRTTGNFYPNNRAVFFNGATGNQTITKTGGETFPFMIVDKASGNVILANNVTVSGGLTLTNGLVEVGTNNMIMGGATLTGGSATSYVKTASTGVMSRNVGASAITFPVGNSSYNPAMVTNAGTADVFTLRVIDNVTSDGTGVGAPTTEAVVNRTWMVNETTTGGSNVTLRLYWNGAGEQINGFSPASAFIAHYIASSGLWDNIGFSGQGAGYFETNNITSFSPFTISSSTTFAPLPIELVSFQANCAGDDKINVTWTTASEHNTSHYIVEHSRNGNDWEALTMVAAAGNSTSLLDYTYVHENPNAGTNYYRLTQYDNDGVFEQFNAVAVDCDNMNNTTALSTYPNPSEGSFYISLFTEDMEGAGVITLTDAKGTVVYTQDVNIQNGNTIFHMDNLNVAPGMYYIQVANGKTSTHIVKHSLR